MGFFKKTPVVIFFLIVAISLFFFYQSVKVPDGVDPMSGTEVMKEVISLIAAIIALLAAIIGFVQKLIEIQHAKRHD